MKIFILQNDLAQLAALRSILGSIPSIEVYTFSETQDCFFEICITSEPYLLITDIKVAEISATNPEPPTISLIEKLSSDQCLLGLIIVSSIATYILESILLMATKFGIKYVRGVKTSNSAEIKNLVEEVLSVVEMDESQLSFFLNNIDNSSKKTSKYEELHELINDDFQPYFQPQVDINIYKIKHMLTLLNNLPASQANIYSLSKEYHPEITRQILDNALNQLVKSTGLTRQQSLSLLSNKANARLNRASVQKSFYHSSAIIEYNELKFIANLFNTNS